MFIGLFNYVLNKIFLSNNKLDIFFKVINLIGKSFIELFSFLFKDYIEYG